MANIYALEIKDHPFYGINLNAFGTPTVTVGDTVLNGCNVTAGSIECSIQNTPAASGGTWRVYISAGNSQNTNDQIDIFIPDGFVTRCITGDTVQCYSGPPSTRDVGICKAGINTCLADRTWSNCTGEIVPRTEMLQYCYDGLDYDCNGLVDDCGPNSVCSSGQTRTCYDGPSGTIGFESCKAGIQTCDQNGQWGNCDGEIVPLREICGDGIDNDCNGLVDEPGMCSPPEPV